MKILGKKTTDEVTALIFDIQHFSIHDGPGIRTTIFFKGCPLRCQWCQNPESKIPGPEIAFYSEQCTECYECSNVCQEGAIINKNNKRIDYTKCSKCGLCTVNCVNNALRLIGEYRDAPTLVEEILKDRDFYIESGGGVTLSGGEPTLNYKFLKLLLPALKKEKIHVNIETCGIFKFEKIKNLLPFIDLIYYDIKHMNDEKHRKYTGAGNKIILENFIELGKIFPQLQARMPLIPEINDDKENITQTALFLKKNNHHTIHCLPYNNMGEAKLIRLNTDQKPGGIKHQSSKKLENIKKLFQEKKIDATIYD